MSKRRLTFPDTNDGDELFVSIWIAYQQGGQRSNDDQELARAEHLLDLRDSISEEAIVAGLGLVRRLVRNQGPQQMDMTIAEYELFRRAVKAFSWPLINAPIARKVREFVDNVETIENGS